MALPTQVTSQQAECI